MTSGSLLALNERVLIVGPLGGGVMRGCVKGESFSAPMTSGDAGSGSMHLGSFYGTTRSVMNADIAEMIVFNRDILTGANVPSRDVIRILAARLYGVQINHMITIAFKPGAAQPLAVCPNGLDRLPAPQPGASLELRISTGTACVSFPGVADG